MTWLQFLGEKIHFCEIRLETFLSFKTSLRVSQTCSVTLYVLFRMKLIVMGANGLSGYAKAWLPGVGRTWSWPCLASSSWSAKRFAEPLYLSGTRRTSCLSGTKLPMILGWLIVFETPSDEFSTYLPELPLSIKLIMTP